MLLFHAWCKIWRVEKERASLFQTLSIIRDAINFEVERQNRALYEGDRVPLSGLEKLSFILSTLKPEELKRVINVISSVNFGRHILTNVFPKSENPEEYHSRNGEVCLSEHPVQVLGWKEKKHLVQEGVKLGFDEDWIVYGFEDEAERRGIDLEWHFAEEPPKVRETSVDLKQLT